MGCSAIGKKNRKITFVLLSEVSMLYTSSTFNFALTFFIIILCGVSYNFTYGRLQVQGCTSRTRCICFPPSPARLTFVYLRNCALKSIVYPYTVTLTQNTVKFTKRVFGPTIFNCRLQT
jgi:hypothetical protein